MKKLVLFMAVATAVAFAACGNNEEATEEVVEEAPVEEAAPAEEEVVVEEVAEEAPAEVVAE